MGDQQMTPYDHIIQKMFDHGISRLKPKDQKTLKTLLAIIIGRTKIMVSLDSRYFQLLHDFSHKKTSNYEQSEFVRSTARDLSRVSINEDTARIRRYN